MKRPVRLVARDARAASQSAPSRGATGIAGGGGVGVGIGGCSIAQGGRETSGWRGVFLATRPMVLVLSRGAEAAADYWTVMMPFMPIAMCGVQL